MIEIRSAAPFCPVLNLCPPDRADAMIDALGLTREQVILTAPEHGSAEERALIEAYQARAEALTMRDGLRDAERRHESLRSELVNTKDELSKIRDELAEANITIRGLCAAFKPLTPSTPDNAPAASEVA